MQFLQVESVSSMANCYVVDAVMSYDPFRIVTELLLAAIEIQFILLFVSRTNMHESLVALLLQ